jgi:predicted ribosome quality control (RQC) complex YloA/Tae2 family protein
MPKTRFTAADVAAQAACIRASCLGARCANVYDLSARTYLFKLNRTGDAAEQAPGGSKTFLLLESGTRFHTTTLLRDKEATPNNIALKLRLHLRTRRLVDVRQLGSDRVVVFTFGAACRARGVRLNAPVLLDALSLYVLPRRLRRGCPPRGAGAVRPGQHCVV